MGDGQAEDSEAAVADGGDADAVWMGKALAEAVAAELTGDVPVGALIVRDGAIVGRGRNRREQDGDPTAHAEIVAIRAAAQAVGGWRLDGCTLYVTLEPCLMCCGAIVNARLDRVVFGAADPKAGGAVSLYTILGDSRLNHRPALAGGVRADECGGVLKRFFARLRAGG